jgi:hypothetical protein
VVPRVIPAEVLTVAETAPGEDSVWVLSRRALREKLDALRAGGFDRVWFAAKACPLPALVSEVIRAGAGILMTSAPEAKQFRQFLDAGHPWGFAVLDEGRLRDLRWVRARSMPHWISVGDAAGAALQPTGAAEQAARSPPALLLRIRPPPDVRSVCGTYGFIRKTLHAVLRNGPSEGIHLHIGSNKTGVRPYLRFLEYARDCWDGVTGGESEPTVVNLGGGFSAGFSHMAELGNRARALFPRVQLWVEPGRYLAQQTLYYAVRGSVDGAEIHTSAELPVSAESTRNAPLLRGLLLTDSGKWTPLTAQVVGRGAATIVRMERLARTGIGGRPDSADTRGARGRARGPATLLFYDCSAYHHLPSVRTALA